MSIDTFEIYLAVVMALSPTATAILMPAARAKAPEKSKQIQRNLYPTLKMATSSDPCLAAITPITVTLQKSLAMARADGTYSL